jgi:TRAP-type mannitol/chloroaromatic compound transport system substrate-binding protein|tara:strand:- start:2071 stop:3096 length:1026 start_codon:yes stop_codon:yes gene_type:complete
MLSFKRIMAVCLMVLISNVYANFVLASVDGPSVFWKFSLWGKRRAFTEGAETLSKRLSEETNGKFKLKIFYGGQLSKSKENLDGLKANSFEMAGFCNFYHPGKNAGLMVLTMPFLPMGDFDKDAKIRHAVYDHPIVKGQLAKWNAMLYMTSNLPQYEFLGKGKPPMNLSDFKGMRVRAGGGVGKAMEKLGAIRQTVPASEVYTLISRGAVDSVSFPFTYAHGAYKIHEVAEWYTANLSPGTSDCPYVINQKSYNKLPKQYKDLLAKLKPEALAAMKVAYKKADEKYLPMFKSKLKEIKYDEKTLAAFRKKAGKPVWDAWVTANKDKFDAQALIDLVFETAK